MRKRVLLALGLSAGLMWAAGCGGDAFETLDSTTPDGAGGGSSGSSTGGSGGTAGNPAGQGGSTGGQGGSTGGQGGSTGGQGGSVAGGGQSGNGQAGNPIGGTGGSTAGSGNKGGAGSGQAGSGQAGSGQAGSGQAGSAQAGSAQAGSAQAGSAQAGSGQAGSGQAGSGQAGQAQAGSGGDGQAGMGQAGSGNGGSAQGGSDTGGQGGSMLCGNPFPAIGKGCTNDESCVSGMHQINCCGAVVAQGFNHAFKDDFTAAESLWESCMPACDCDPDSPKAEDGKYISDGTLAVACTNNQCFTYVKTTGAGGAGGSGGGGSGGSGAGGGAGGMCDATFPTFDNACQSNDECLFGIHQLDCCGSQAAIGFNVADNNAFTSAENEWLACHPAACGCPAQPTTTDNGSTTDNSKITVACQGGFCKTKSK